MRIQTVDTVLFLVLRRLVFPQLYDRVQAVVLDVVSTVQKSMYVIKPRAHFDFDLFTFFFFFLPENKKKSSGVDMENRFATSDIVRDIGCFLIIINCQHASLIELNQTKYYCPLRLTCTGIAIGLRTGLIKFLKTDKGKEQTIRNFQMCKNIL